MIMIVMVSSDTFDRFKSFNLLTVVMMMMIVVVVVVVVVIQF